jgi:hypothetical protein
VVSWVGAAGAGGRVHVLCWGRCRCSLANHPITHHEAHTFTCIYMHIHTYMSYIYTHLSQPPRRRHPPGCVPHARFGRLFVWCVCVCVCVCVCHVTCKQNPPTFQHRLITHRQQNALKTQSKSSLTASASATSKRPSITASSRGVWPLLDVDMCAVRSDMWPLCIRMDRDGERGD